LVEILCFFQSKNSRCRKASRFSGKYRKTPQAVGKVTAAVFKFGVNRSVRPNGCSPFAARLRLLTITGELLSEDQIVHVPVFPYTVPDAVWLTLHHRHADSPPDSFDLSGYGAHKRLHVRTGSSGFLQAELRRLSTPPV
jgi:hypothetical protein